LIEYGAGLSCEPPLLFEFRVLWGEGEKEIIERQAIVFGEHHGYLTS